MGDPDDHSEAGTGNELGRVDLGALGELVVYDDGDPDPYVTIRKPHGAPASLDALLRSKRNDMGDEAFTEALAKLPTPSNKPTTTTNWRSGPFVCHDCHRTWPSKRNQTPDADADTCPECDGS